MSFSYQHLREYDSLRIVSPDGKYVVSGLDVDCGICLTDAENAKMVSYVRGEFAQSPCSVLPVTVIAACHLTDHNFRLLYLVKL